MHGHLTARLARVPPLLQDGRLLQLAILPLSELHHHHITYHITYYYTSYYIILSELHHHHQLFPTTTTTSYNHNCYLDGDCCIAH